MYVAPQNGQAAAQTVAPTLHVGTYRRAIMSAMSADAFTPTERLRANHAVYECQDAAKLALWLTNVTRIRAEREAAQQAEGFANLAEGLARFEAKQAAEQPATEQPAPTPAAATPAQCDEIYRLACLLSPREKKDALRRLPALSEAEAQAFLRGLHLRRSCRLRVEAGGLRLTVAEYHHEAAKVDYVLEEVTGRVLPRRETSFGGPLARRVWAN